MKTTPKAFCPNCYDKEMYHVTSDMQVASIRDVTFAFLEHTATCDVCGTKVYVPAVADMNLYERFKAYYNRLGEINNGDNGTRSAI